VCAESTGTVAKAVVPDTSPKTPPSNAAPPAGVRMSWAFLKSVLEVAVTLPTVVETPVAPFAGWMSAPLARLTIVGHTVPGGDDWLAPPPEHATEISAAVTARARREARARAITARRG